MSYKLVLSEPIDIKDKELGENVFFDNLPYDCKVYLFFYPSAMPDEELESKLRKLGDLTGKNLFVNIGRLDDPSYSKIANKFKIKSLPVIVMTAIDKFASPEREFITAYVRIDSQSLLKSSDVTIQCVQKLYNLFIQEKMTEALKQFEQDKRDLFLSKLKAIVIDALKGIWKFIKESDISISLLEGKFELKHGGG